MGASGQAPGELTTAEAAFVLDMTPENVRSALKKVLSMEERRELGENSAVMLRHEELVVLHYTKTHPSMTPEQRAQLHKRLRLRKEGIVRRHPAGKRRLQDTKIPITEDRTMLVDIGPTVLELNQRMARLEELRGAVEDGPDGEPVLKGTRIPLYRVAALAQEVEGTLHLDEARLGFPSLNDTQLLAACEYAKAYPKKGKPYPPKSLKTVLGDLNLREMFETSDDD
jgi:uncharacterized protein (DUF433 family)